MISKMSLFNKGIYKSTLRRFYLGSVAYFILLFMVSTMIVLLNADNTYRRDLSISYLLSCGITDVSMIISIGIPTVVALLIYRFVHSRKSAIFVHSLPVSRNANYISSLAAALTLMIAPIVLNGIILMLMSLSGHWPLLDIYSCLVWMGLCSLAVFILFAYSGFCAMITGNSFAFVALNILIHCIIPLIVACFGILSECFLYGYDNTNLILNFVCENNPIMFLSALTSQVGNYTPVIDVSKIIWHIVIAVILYALTLILYKKRRMETAEDVAAYKCLNPIYKYLISFLGAILSFAIFGELALYNYLWLLSIVLIISTVLYFAAEMILKKTVRVWKKSFKGYLAFLVGLGIVFGIFSLTSFFGYETYIPKKEKVVSASIYSYYNQSEKPYTKKPEIIDLILNAHSDFTNNIPENAATQNSRIDGGTRLHIEYTLSNGRKVGRVYPVSYDKCHEIMTKIYADEDYKKTYELIFELDIKKIYELNALSGSNRSIDAKMHEDLLVAIKKDILMLDYDRIHTDSAKWHHTIEIVYADDKDTKTYTQLDNGDILPAARSNIEINNNYENTIRWFKENGYWDAIKPQVNEDIRMYLCTYKDYMNSLLKDKKVVTPKGSYVSGSDIPQNAIELDKQKLCNFIETYKPRYIYGDDYYVITNYTDGQIYPAYDVDTETAQKLIEELGL